MYRRGVAPAILILVLAAGLAGIVSVASPSPAVAAPGPGKLAYADSAGIWTSDSNGGNAVLILPPVDGKSPSGPKWSHDGTKIAYGMIDWHDIPGFRTWVANADGSGARSVTSARNAFWSLDDRRLLFVDEASSGGIGYVEVDGSGEEGNLFYAPVGYGDIGGDLSPDGSRIAFTRTSDAVGRIFLVDTDGTDLVRVTDGGGGSDGDVRWSPDGTRLLLHTVSGLNSARITVVNADGSGRRTVRENAWPWGWSPDGSQILFRNNTDDYRIWRMQADGSGAEPLAVAGRIWGGVDWSAPRPTVSAVSAGGLHTVALGTDGLVRTFGSSGYGQVGIAGVIEARTPTVVPSLGAAYGISAGMFHSVVVMDDGTVRAFGYNGLGGLGDGTNTDRRTPVVVPGLSSMVATSVGAYHSLALRSDGTVWAWGWNVVGQVGDGTTTDRYRPVPVPGLTDIVAVSAGAYHSLALRSDGTVWAWGYNGQGELGTGSPDGDAHIPTKVTGVGAVTSISAGLYHSMAIRSDGTLWAWGYNIFGQLGTGDRVSARWPVLVAGLRAARSVGAGGLHSVVSLDDGSVWTWGWNGLGQLGDGTTTDSLSPVRVKDLGAVTSVSAGLVHNVALLGGRTMWTWGWNVYGQLGAPTGGVAPLRVLPVT